MGKLQEFNELWKKYVEKEKIRILQKTSPEFVEFIRNITFKDMYFDNSDSDDMAWDIELKYYGECCDFRNVYGEEFIDYHDVLNEDDSYEFYELLNEVDIREHMKELRQEKLEKTAKSKNEIHQELSIKQVIAAGDGKHLIYELNNGEKLFVKHSV